MPLWNSSEIEKKGKYNWQNRTVAQHFCVETSWQFLWFLSFLKYAKKKNDLGTSSFRSSVSLQKVQVTSRGTIEDFNYSEIWWKKRKICGVSMHFPGFDHLFAHSIWNFHTRPVQSMILESDSVFLCVVILWMIYFNFSLESKHVSACFWNSVWAPVTWAYIFQQALILRRQHSVLTAFRVWWRERGGGWERSRGVWGGGWVWQRRNPGLSNVTRRRAAGK